MRLAVVQMQALGERDDDVAATARLIAAACDRGAAIVVVPLAASLREDGAALDSLRTGGSQCPDGVETLLVRRAQGADPSVPQESPLGRLVTLAADDAIDPAVLGQVVAVRPDALLLSAEPESPLQAEAVLELAVGYSTSVAGLVIVSGTTLLDPAGDTYGASAIIQHGEVLAEAVEPEEILTAEIDPPVRLQEPVSPLPEPQLILRQRLAHHRGGKAEVEWLADLD